jgi:hypothetical protein
VLPRSPGTRTNTGSSTVRERRSSALESGTDSDGAMEISLINTVCSG